MILLLFCCSIFIGSLRIQLKGGKKMNVSVQFFGGDKDGLEDLKSFVNGLTLEGESCFFLKVGVVIDSKEFFFCGKIHEIEKRVEEEKIDGVVFRKLLRKEFQFK